MSDKDLDVRNAAGVASTRLTMSTRSARTRQFIEEQGAYRRPTRTPLRLVDVQGLLVAGAVVGTVFARDRDRERSFTSPESVESRTTAREGRGVVDARIRAVDGRIGRLRDSTRPGSSARRCPPVDSRGDRQAGDDRDASRLPGSVPGGVPGALRAGGEISCRAGRAGLVASRLCQLGSRRTIRTGPSSAGRRRARSSSCYRPAGSPFMPMVVTRTTSIARSKSGRDMRAQPGYHRSASRWRHQGWRLPRLSAIDPAQSPGGAGPGRRREAVHVSTSPSRSGAERRDPGSTGHRLRARWQDALHRPLVQRRSRRGEALERGDRRPDRELARSR